MRRTLLSHTEEVTALAFSPSVELLASASWDTTVKIWHVPTGTLKQTLSGHEKEVTAVAFSPDGRSLASASWDGSVRVWDLDTDLSSAAEAGVHEQGRQLAGHEKEVSSLAFSPAGRILASASWNVIHLWNAATSELVHQLRGHGTDITTLTFSPDGHILASTAERGPLLLWDPTTGQQAHPLQTHGDAFALAFSPDSQTIVISSGGKKSARLFDVATGEQIGRPLGGHRVSPATVSFSPSGREIATGSWDRTIRIWDAETQEQLRMLGPCSEGVKIVEFSPSGRLVVSGCWPEEEFRLWDWRSGEVVGGFDEGAGFRVSVVGFSPRGGGEVVWVAQAEDKEILLVRMEVREDG